MLNAARGRSTGRGRLIQSQRVFQTSSTRDLPGRLKQHGSQVGITSHCVLAPTTKSEGEPAYRNFSFPLKVPVTVNGTVIDASNKWMETKLPHRLSSKKRQGDQDMENKPVVLLTDSICKHVSHVWDMDLVAYPGSNVDEFLARVRLNRIPELSNACAVIIHVGTNNLQTDTEADVAHKVLQLARLLYGKHGIPVIISLLIPRLDSVKLDTSARKVNDFIKRGINSDHMHCLFTYRLFSSFGKPNPDLYCHLDKIHPNARGNRLLFGYMATRVNELRKRMGAPKSQKPPPPKKIIRRANSRW